MTKATVKKQTHYHYACNLRVHLMPALASRPVGHIKHGALKEFLVKKLNEGLAPKTVHHLRSSLHGIFQHAIDMGIMESNPAAGLARKLRLVRRANCNRERPFSEQGLRQLLQAAREIRPDPKAHKDTAMGRDFAAIFTLACTGLRVNEGLALQEDDLDFTGRLIRVRRIWSGGEIDTPKTEMSERSVDMTRILRDVLREHLRQKREEKLRYGWPELPPWVFVDLHGRPIQYSAFQRRFVKILRFAGLAEHHTLHDLRHTFASLHLQRGASMYYVQRQLGHASIQMTVDLYGRWARASNHEIADRLEEVFEGAQGRLW